MVAVALSLAAIGLSGTGSAAPETPRCLTSQLHVWMTRSGAAAGTVGGYLAFTNRSWSACALSGWPTLTALRPGASTTAIHVRETMFGPYVFVGGIGHYVRGVPTVRLRHGQTAVAAFTAGDHGPTSAPCPPPYTRLRVAPPGNATSVLIPAWIAYYGQNLPSCTAIEVSMVVPASDLPSRG